MSGEAWTDLDLTYPERTGEVIASVADTVTLRRVREVVESMGDPADPKLLHPQTAGLLGLLRHVLDADHNPREEADKGARAGERGAEA